MTAVESAKPCTYLFLCYSSSNFSGVSPTKYFSKTLLTLLNVQEIKAANSNAIGTFRTLQFMAVQVRNLNAILKLSVSRKKFYFSTHTKTVETRTYHWEMRSVTETDRQTDTSDYRVTWGCAVLMMNAAESLLTAWCSSHCSSVVSTPFFLIPYTHKHTQRRGQRERERERNRGGAVGQS